jgi:rod shape-determining protein MreD
MKPSNNIRLLFFCLGLMALQILVLNQIELHRTIYPQVYILGFLLFPINTRHWVVLLIGFFSGLCLDMFTNTPGIHAMSLTAILYLRHFYFSNYFDKNKLELNLMPTYDVMDSGFYLGYLAVFTVAFHTLFFVLLFFSFAHKLDILQSIFISSSLSILLMLMLQFMFNPKQEEDI